jgi:hypothetical protein
MTLLKLRKLQPPLAGATLCRPGCGRVRSAATAATMAAIRTLQVTSLPAWSNASEGVSFTFTHDRSMDVILQNQRGEGFVKQVFRYLLSYGCGTRVDGAGLVLDIGSNTGYYSMASAAHGCQVLAFDAQPGCKQWFEQARAANERNHSRMGGPQAAYFDARRVGIVTRPVSANPTPIEIDQWACWVMHKIDVRLDGRRRRRRIQTANAEARAAPAVAVTNGLLSPSPPSPPPPPPSPPPGENLPAANPGKVAARPVGSLELLSLVQQRQASSVLLAKIDTEGAELGVLAALEPLLPQVENLLVEIAPGWWPLYANKSAVGAGRGGRSAMRGAKGRGATPRAAERDADAKPGSQMRANGAEQLSRLLRSKEKGGAGFTAALTSNARLFTSSERLHDFLVGMGSNGYWNQADVWFARDAHGMRSARTTICLRQQSTERAKSMCYHSGQGTSSGAGSPSPMRRSGGAGPRRGRGGRGGAGGRGRGRGRGAV